MKQLYVEIEINKGDFMRIIKYSNEIVSKDCNKFIIPVSLSVTISNIRTPTKRLIYILNSGLYCFKIIIIISPN